MTSRTVAATASCFLRINYAILIVLFFPLSLAAQYNYRIDQTIPVSLSTSADPLSLAWAGGLNASQYNTMDLNGDGNDDLVLFDRTANKVICYLNVDNEYVYASDYEAYFPELNNWLLLRDYNCDGKKDIFTSDIFGIKVYINTTTAGPLTWEQFFTFNGVSGHSPVILTKGFSSKINLQLQFDDLPAINDMDGDGDLDILAMRFPAGGTIEFHKNFSKERYGTCDSLDFERVDQSWGDVTECGCGNFEFNGNDCPDGGRVKHAGGKTILAIDVDGDADQDVLFSEASCNQLYLLRNTGTVENAIVSSSALFPSSVPVNFELFPGSYFEDVDFDNVKDLIVAPNIYLNDFPANFPDLRHSNWFYKNNGTNASPSFSFVKTDFLQGQMIDVGDNAVPAFADYDKDGDQDLFISQFSTPSFVGTITLYKNIGTTSAPEFVLESEDYVGFSGLNLFNVRLQWVDITGDGNIDMVFTGTSFQDGLTMLYFVENKSSGGFNFGGGNLVSTEFNVSRSENVYVVDIDQDGALDLLVGKSNGALQYWRNTGSPGTFNYTLADESYLNVGVSVTRQNLRPLVADLEADGEDDLVLGDQTGILQIVGDFRDASDISEAATDIIFNELENDYFARNLGGRIWPDAANLFNSNKPVLVVGNIMGGLHILRNDNDNPLPDEPDIKIYPIPVSRQQQNIHIQSDRPVMIEVFSSLGQRVTPPAALKANRWTEISVASLSGGVYLLRFTSGDKTTVRRIVVY